MSLKDYESEGSAIRRIMHEKLVTHHDRGVDTPHYQATMAKRGKVKLRKSGDYDDHGTHTVYASPEDVQKYMAKGYKKVPMDEEHCCEDCEHMAEGLDIEDAMIMENGEKKNVKLNKPQRTPGGPKKFAVYVRNDKGNIVKVTFGDPNLSIKRDDPERRKSFRARHNCADPGPKWKARYWSCRNWRASAKVGEEVEESINIIEEKIPSKLMTLLRMGLVEKGELETMKRALKSGEDALTQPVLRKQIYELFNKLVEAITDDQQIWVRMRKRLQTDNKEEE